MGQQQLPRIIGDGAGGAIMVWTDGRNGTDYNIFAQRIDANGSVQWTLDGIPICAAPFNQEYPVIASDGAGGAMITWQDRRNGAGADIYAQHVDASGLVQWTADGIAICTAASDQWSPEIIGDGAGTAIITWEDNRSGAGLDIYAQRLNSSGAILWMANGVPICSAIDSQRYPVVVGDGTGGAIVTWEDWQSDRRGYFSSSEWMLPVTLNGPKMVSPSVFPRTTSSIRDLRRWRWW
ncbi:MAG: hypothetical protein IPG92_17900, partial [Flavobacteriales bacterium]|nr:hypothetical protein [Flavobacteriales bacterium]